MLPRKDTGNILYDTLDRVINIEKIIFGRTPDPLTTQNLNVLNSLTLSYVDPKLVLFSDPDKKIIGTTLSSLFIPVSQQTTITGNVDGTVTVGTSQNISSTSSPEFNNLTLDGQLKVNTKAQIASSLYTTAPVSSLEIFGNSDSTTTLDLRRSDNTINSSNILMQKSRGTLNIPTSVQTADVLGKISFSGYDGTNWGTSSVIGSMATENYNLTSHGSRLEIYTTPNGTVNLSKVVGIENNGVVTIYSTIDSSNISTGAVIINGGVGITKQLNVGSNATISGSATVGGALIVNSACQFISMNIYGSTDTQSIDTGVLTVYGGTSIRKNLFVGANLSVGNITPSTVYISNITTSAGSGNMLRMQANTNSANFIMNSDGSLQINTSGTATQSMQLNGTHLDINFSTPSGATNSGALVVTGGVGVGGNLNIGGTISKTGGSFLITHPDPAKKDWKLRHCFVETNTRGDNIYRYKVNIQNNKGSIQLPTYFKYLNENPQVWVNGNNLGNYGVGNIDENLDECIVEVNNDGVYNVLIIGTRKDEIMKEYWDEFKDELPPNL